MCLILTAAGLRVLPESGLVPGDEVAVTTDQAHLGPGAATFQASAGGDRLLAFEGRSLPVTIREGLPDLGLGVATEPSHFASLHDDGDWSFRSTGDGVRILRPEWGLDHPLPEAIEAGQFLFDRVDGIGLDERGPWVATALGTDRIEGGRLLPAERGTFPASSGSPEPEQALEVRVGTSTVEVDRSGLHVDGTTIHEFAGDHHAVRIGDRLWLVEPGADQPVRWFRLEDKWVRPIWNW